MSNSYVVQNIVTIEIELEEDDGTPVDQTAPGEERELTDTTKIEGTLTEQEDNEKKPEESREEETKVTIEQEKADELEEPKRVEAAVPDGRLPANSTYINNSREIPVRLTDAATNTREKAEEKRDGDDKPIGKADNETGEGGSGEGGGGQSGSSQGTSDEGTCGEGASGDGASGEKKAKMEERSIVDDDDSNSNNSSECFIVFD